jgi:uncharacterized protein
MDVPLSVILQELKEQLESLYGDRLCQVILYGSQARGSARSDSDVDVLVVLKEPFDYVTEVKRTNEFVSELCLDHEVLVSVAFAASNQFQTAQTPFFLNVHREGIAV